MRPRHWVVDVALSVGVVVLSALIMALVMGGCAHRERTSSVSAAGQERATTSAGTQGTTSAASTSTTTTKKRTTTKKTVKKPDGTTEVTETTEDVGESSSADSSLTRFSNSWNIGEVDRDWRFAGKQTERVFWTWKRVASVVVGISLLAGVAGILVYRRVRSRMLL